MRDKIKFLLQRLRSFINIPKGVYYGDDMVIAKIHRFKMLLPTKDLSMTPCMLLDGFWEPKISSFFVALVKKGDTVLDVGAAFGYYTLLSAGKVGANGKVIAFEPDPANYKIVKNNCFMNGFIHRVTVINSAASDKKEIVPFYYKSDYVWGAQSLIGTSGERTIDVETVIIDDYLTKMQVDRVDVVKIDVEGYEPFVIRGMLKTINNNKNIKIVFEFSPGYFKALEFTPADFIDELCDMGFQTIMKINEFTGKLENISDFDLESDELFMCYLEK